MPDLNSAASCVRTRFSGDAELRAAYDALELQVAKHALADKVHKLASGVMALAGVLEEFEAEWGKRIRHS